MRIFVISDTRDSWKWSDYYGPFSANFDCLGWIVIVFFSCSTLNISCRVCQLFIGFEDWWAVKNGFKKKMDRQKKWIFPWRKKKLIPSQIGVNEVFRFGRNGSVQIGRNKVSQIKAEEEKMNFFSEPLLWCKRRSSLYLLSLFQHVSCIDGGGTADS